MGGPLNIKLYGNTLREYERISTLRLIVVGVNNSCGGSTEELIFTPNSSMYYLTF